MTHREADKYLRKRVLLYMRNGPKEFFVDDVSPSGEFIRLTYSRNFEDGLVQTVSEWVEYDAFKIKLREVL